MRKDPQSLTVKHKPGRQAVSLELLAHVETTWKAILFWIVTADETCRPKGIPWNGTIPQASQKKKLTLCQQTCLQPLLTRTVKEWSLCMKCQEGRKLTLCQNVERTHEGIQMSWPHKNSAEVLIQHDNARLHTCLKYQQAITQFGWSVLPHLPCSRCHTRRFPTVWSPEGCCLWWEVWD